MKIGKLTNEQLKGLVLSALQPHRDDVVLRPGIGMDCGGIRVGEEVVILSTDPITAASHDAGRLVVHISCNDVAAAGAEPIGLLLTVMAPPHATPEMLTHVMEQARQTAVGLNVEIIGGHTEVTDAVRRIVLSATVIGKALNGRYFSAAGAKPGDVLILTKWVGMEGTAIIASDCPERLTGCFTEVEILEACSLSERVSVVREGMLAASLPVTAMHDVTEGGVLGAVWEMAEASGCGALLDASRIPMLDITRKICRHLELDPLRLISSGCMLMAAHDGQAVMDAMTARGIPAAIIGKMTNGPVCMIKDGAVTDVAPPGPDELYRIIETASEDA